MRLCGGIQAIGLVSLIRLKKVNSDGSMEVTPSTLIGTVMVEFGQSPTTPVAMKIAQR
jgi:hypothetical protein